MEDIAPGLIKKIQADFQSMFDKSDNISTLYVKVRDGTATYVEANDFAIETGEILATAFSNNLSSAVLPEGKMYYNIAQRIIEPMMVNNYNLISNISLQVQEILNKSANIGIRAIKPGLNTDKIQGIIDRVSSADDFDKVAWVLDEPIKTFSQSIVDDAIRENAEFHSKSGLRPKIVRRVAGNCCEWCSNLAGSYTYPDEVPDDVYRRHQRCRCTVDYKPGDGKVQNVHSKRWKTEEERGKIEARKQIAKTDSDQDTRKTEYRKHVGENGLSYAESRAITNYVSSESYVINDKLRRGENLTNSERMFCKDLDSALKKMPTYEGNLSRSLFFYTQDDAEKYVEDFCVNEEKVFVEYVSTTKGSELYNPEGQVQIYIQNSAKGHDLKKFNETELEVLYERNSKFVVASKIKNDNVWYILLEEE